MSTRDRDGLAHRMCLVPTGNYFGWGKRGQEKIKYSIGQNEHGIIYMAGIYHIEGSRPVFSILTREPASKNAFIHDRMPVILTHEPASQIAFIYDRTRR